ncbi:MAG: hypothetical protein KUG52_06580 [Immundisolibacteraceae bacterium]|nr:hypothetical protein [Immundisolibacteraceae bacterium]
MTDELCGMDVQQQLDDLELVMEDLRDAIMTTDSSALVECSGELQTVVSRLDRHYDSLNDPSVEISEKVVDQLTRMRRKLVGIGTLLQLSRAKAADLLELMLGASTTGATYSQNGRMGMVNGSGRSISA